MKILHILNELKFSGAKIIYVSAAPEFEKLRVSPECYNMYNKVGYMSVISRLSQKINYLKYTYEYKKL